MRSRILRRTLERSEAVPLLAPRLAHAAARAGTPAEARALSLVLLQISLVALAVGLRVGVAVADEERFNPPLRGAFLGVELVEEAAGLRISRVLEDSPAGAARLASGDVILAWRSAPAATDAATTEAAATVGGGGGEGTRGDGGSGGGKPGEAAPGNLPDRADRPRVDELLAELGRRPPGSLLVLEVVRNGARLSATVRLDPLRVHLAYLIAEVLVDHPLFLEAEAAAGATGRLARLGGEMRTIFRTSRRLHESEERINDLLGTLGVSHTAFIPEWSYRQLLAPSSKESSPGFHLGVLLQEVEVEGRGRWFARELWNGGPAEEAGLRLGDEVATVNGIPFEESPRRILAGYEAERRLWTIEIDKDERVTLGVRRRAGAETAPLEVAADLPLSSLRAVRASVRTLESAAGPLGYVHLWDLLPPRLPSLLSDILEDDLKAARGLLVDLRGRGGRVDVLEGVARLLRKDGRPIALLIDSQARSAKEVLAQQLRGSKGITLVGERTAGAVRGSGYLDLPTGDKVMLPVRGARSVVELTDGIDLESRGAAPDIVVDLELPYAGGRDSILARAVQDLEARLLHQPRTTRI